MPIVSLTGAQAYPPLGRRPDLLPDAYRGHVQLPFQSERDRISVSNRNRLARVIISPTDSMHEKSNRAVAANQPRRNRLCKRPGPSYLHKSGLLTVVQYVNEHVGPVVIVDLEDEFIVNRGRVRLRVVSPASGGQYQSRARNKSPSAHFPLPQAIGVNLARETARHVLPDTPVESLWTLGYCARMRTNIMISIQPERTQWPSPPRQCHV